MIPTYANFKSFLKAMVGYAKTGFQPVSQSEANRRASLCASCHNNQFGKGCRGCGVQGLRRLIKGHRSTPYDGALKTCALCGCDNQASVWIPLKAFGYTQADANAWPSFCWKRDAT